MSALKKILIVCISFFVFVAGGCSFQDAREVYGVNIEYKNFSEMDDYLKNVQPGPIPNDLEKYIFNKHHRPRIENPERFQREVWEEAERLGYLEGSAPYLGIKESIMLAVKISVSQFVYFDVDHDKKFIEKHGSFLPIDEYFHLRLGDCDKYRDATIAIFDMIKVVNPRLENVYLSTELLGGNGDAPHAWVSIIIAEKDRLVLSHIDPTFYDAGQPLDAEEFHISLQNDYYIASFYLEISETVSDFEFVLPLFNEAYNRTESGDLKKRAFYNIIYCADMLVFSEPRLALKTIRWAEDQKEILEDRASLLQLVQVSYSIYSEVGDKERAKEFKEILYSEFPDSFWTKALKIKEQIE